MTNLKSKKPALEEIINTYLKGDILTNALNLIKFLRENKMNPNWVSTNAWKISYKNFNLCYIRFYIDTCTLNVQPFIGEYDKNELSDEFKEIIWSNKKPCCGGCSVKIYQVFGKEFNNACEKSFTFNNPNNKEIDCIKRLLELRKKTIQEGKAKKHVYIAMKNR